MPVVYVGLGSNLADPLAQLKDAKHRLAATEGIDILEVSSIYLSRAMTLPDDTDPQDDYLNAVVKLRYDGQPRQLLDHIRRIEDEQGRQRQKVWGARTIDLDILMYDDLHMRQADLEIPHPGIAVRSFVLLPLNDIDPELVIPGQGRVSELLADLTLDDIRRYGTFDE